MADTITDSTRRTLRTTAWGVALAAVATAAVTISTVSPAAAAGECGVTDALQNVYVGPNNGSWTSAINWSKNELPGIGNICVPAGKTVLVPTGTEMVFPGGNSVGTLRIAGTVRIQATNAVVSSNNVYGGTNLINTGRIEVTNGATLNLMADQNGAPAFVNAPGAVIAVEDGAHLVLHRPILNRGQITMATGGTFTLPSSASAYSGIGTVTGGRIRLEAGSVNFSTGRISVLALGGTVRGTVSPTSALDMGCETSSRIVALDSLTNNGTVRLRPPLDGAACSITFSLPGGTTFRNNGLFAVGDRAHLKGFGYYGSNVYDSGGTFANGADGTVRIDDFFGSNIGRIANAGRMELTAAGTLSNTTSTPLLNTGTIVNNGTLDVAAFTNRGTLDLVESADFRGVVTLTGDSVLKVRSSKQALTGITALSPGSTLGGRLVVITSDANRPKLGSSKSLVATAGNTSKKFDTIVGNVSKTLGYKVVYTGTTSGAVELRVVKR